MSAAMSLRVLTLNVWGLEGAPARQAVAQEAIAAIDPDLLALQEVARIAERDQLSELLAGTGLHAVHQLDVLVPDESARRAGTALATRWPPAAIEAVELSSEMRALCALAAVVPLPIGQDVLFISAKPAWRLDAEGDRVAQAREIADLDSRLRRPAPTIVAGDFDATPASDSMRYLTGLAAVDGHSVHYHDAWEVAGDGGPGHTWTSDNPLAAPVVDELIGQTPHQRRIDYVLVGSRHAHPDVAARIRRCEVVLIDPPVSDHYGVLAEIELERRA